MGLLGLEARRLSWLITLKGDTSRYLDLKHNDCLKVADSYPLSMGVMAASPAVMLHSEEGEEENDVTCRLLGTSGRIIYGIASQIWTSIKHVML